MGAKEKKRPKQTEAERVFNIEDWEVALSVAIKHAVTDLSFNSGKRTFMFLDSSRLSFYETDCKFVLVY